MTSGEIRVTGADLNCLFYAISLREDLRFVSFDSELREFLCTKGLKDTLLIP